MQLKQLLADDDAVSPVIGVILMVAITVILAAVIGTFVLGLGEQVQTTSPTVQFTFDYTEDGSGNGELSITHDGGDGVGATQLSIVNAGTTFAVDSSGDENLDDADWFTASGSTVTAGDSMTLYEDTSQYSGSVSTSFDPSQSASVVWNAEDGDRSSTLAEWEP